MSRYIKETRKWANQNCDIFTLKNCNKKLIINPVGAIDSKGIVYRDKYLDEKFKNI